MMLMILERVTPGVRGDLSRWLIEPKPGVFIGYVNAMVRDRLWDKCCKSCSDGGVLQVWSANNEQRFQMRVYGELKRELIDFEGIQLVRRR